jgi:CHAT domain-containing protein
LRARLLLSLVALVAGAAALWRAVPARAVHCQLGIQSGATATVELAGDGRACALVELKQGEFLQFAVVQQGIDVVTELRDPSDNLMLSVDGPLRRFGTERGFALAPIGGRFRIDVISLEPHGRGRLTIRVEALRPAAARDRLLAAAAEISDRTLRTDRAGCSVRCLRQAEGWCQEALRLWIAAGEADQVAFTRFQLGTVKRFLADSAGALQQFRQVLPYWHGRPEEARLLNFIGNCEQSLGLVEAGYRHFEEAERLARERRDLDGEAVSLANLSAVDAARGETQKALDEAWLALRKCQAARDDEGVAIQLPNLGDLYLQLGRPEVAAEMARRSLAARRRAGLRGHHDPWRILGLSYMAMERWRPAVAALDRSLQLCGMTGRAEAAIYILDAIALALLGNGQPEQALARLDRALDLARQSGDRKAEADTLANFGEVAGLGQGDWERALSYLAQARLLYEGLGARAALPGVRYAQGLALWKTGRREEAVAAFEDAIDGVESLRSQPRRGDLRASLLADRREYFSSFVALLAELDRLQPGRGWGARALSVVERARARSFLEDLRAAQTKVIRGVDQGLRQRKIELERQIASRQLSAGLRAGGDAGLQTDRGFAELLDRYEDLKAQIQIESPQYAALTQPRSFGLTDAQRLLDADTSMLVYILGKEGSALLHVTREGVSIHSLPPRQELERLARQVYGRLVENRARASLPGLIPGLRRLSELLLGPVAPALGHRRLVVLGDGFLDYLPFGALLEPSTLRRGAAAPRYLVERHEIAYLPSASVLEVLRQELAKRSRPAKAIALVADPVVDREDPRLAGLPRAGRPAPEPRPPAPLELAARDAGLEGFRRLPHTGEEAASILRRVSPGDAFLAVGFDANLGTVKSPELRDFRILHFATHGLLNEKHPQLSGLVLSLFDERGRRRDGFLRLYDVYNLDLPADLVVLSACRTALGRQVRGEGLIGLARGFMYAGAPRVVVSLWNVDDAATAKLMDRFYRHLLNGKQTPAAALRQAQAEMSADPVWGAPYYWAGFVLQGDWR